MVGYHFLVCQTAQHSESSLNLVKTKVRKIGIERAGVSGVLIYSLSMQGIFKSVNKSLRTSGT